MLDTKAILLALAALKMRAKRWPGNPPVTQNDRWYGTMEEAIADEIREDALIAIVVATARYQGIDISQLGDSYRLLVGKRPQDEDFLAYGKHSRQ